MSVDQEEKLLLQLRQITWVMQQGRLVDGITSETETLKLECDQEFTGQFTHTINMKHGQEVSVAAVLTFC